MQENINYLKYKNIIQDMPEHLQKDLQEHLRVDLQEFLKKYLQEYAQEYSNFAKAYKPRNVHHEHDKIMKKILSNKNEAVILLNDIIKPAERLAPTEIETIEKEFITYNFEIREADIIYKIKNKDVYIVIEHQSKIDYSMPYRIAQYKFETLERTINKDKLKMKNYKVPRIIGLLIYTGKNKWKVEQNVKDKQVEYLTKIKEETGIGSYYLLLDVNDYNKKELLEKGTLLSKIMLIEKSTDVKDLVVNLQAIINKLENEVTTGRTSAGEKELFYNYLRKIILKKLPQKEVTQIIKEIKNKQGVDEDMGTMAVFDMLEREKRKESQMYINMGKREGILAGKREGKREGQREGQKLGIMKVARKLKQMKMSISEIREATGLTEKEIKEIK